MKATLNFKNLLEAEYKAAKASVNSQKEKLKNSKKSPERFREELRKYLEMIIMVKGHAWCMDVSGERKKMSKLMADAITDILQSTTLANEK